MEKICKKKIDTIITFEEVRVRGAGLGVTLTQTTSTEASVYRSTRSEMNHLISDHVVYTHK